MSLISVILIGAEGVKGQELTEVCAIVSDQPGNPHCHDLQIGDTSCLLGTICVGEEISFYLISDCWNQLYEAYINNGHTVTIHYDFNGAPTNPSTVADPNDNTNDPVTVSYTTPGLYQVDLYSYDNAALHSHNWGYVRVLPAPDASFDLSSNSICLGGQVCVTLNNDQYGFNEIIGIDWGDLINCFGQQNAGHPLFNFPNCYIYDRQGIYTVTVIASNGCPPDDTASMTVEVSLQPEFTWVGLCPNSLVTFNGFSCNDGSVAQWQWNFGDGSTSNLQNPTHVYQNAGTFNVTLTVLDNFSNCPGSTSITHTVTITEVESPIIVGNNNNCDSTATYTISNANSNYTYTWTIDSVAFSSSFPMTGATINVVWEDLWWHLGEQATFTWMYVTVVDSATGCTSKDSIKIWRCCSNHVPNNYINDVTITNANQLNISGVLNGTITINADITLIPLYVYMGPEAKIVVNPPYTFTVTGSKIYAGCKYMWDGIYVTDSNAKVIIENKSEVYDAFNAIMSEHGGKFELSNSMFYNNYISVLAKNLYFGLTMPTYTYQTHRGFIHGCTFDKQGIGMIAPYYGQKPRYGVYVDNVKWLTIGDSTAASDTNLFRNLFCGVYSKNSGVKLVNNNFRNIINTSICWGLPNPISISCETAIFSIYFNPNNLSVNSSQLICGGGAAYTRNYFNTCRYGIYTYKTLTGITKNKMYNTPNGILCRDIRGGSVILLTVFLKPIYIMEYK